MRRKTPARDGEGNGFDNMVNISVMGRRALRIRSPILAGTGNPENHLPGYRTFEGEHYGRRDHRHIATCMAVHHGYRGIHIPVCGIVAS